MAGSPAAVAAAPALLAAAPWAADTSRVASALIASVSALAAFSACVRPSSEPRSRSASRSSRLICSMSSTRFLDQRLECVGDGVERTIDRIRVVTPARLSEPDLSKVVGADRHRVPKVRQGERPWDNAQTHGHARGHVAVVR